MHANPFESSPPPAPAGSLRPASRLPYGMAVAIGLGCGVISVLGWIYAHLSMKEIDPALLGPLWQIMVGVLTDIVLGGLTGFLLTRLWCERHGWSGQRRPWLMLGSALLGCLLMLVLMQVVLFNLWHQFFMLITQWSQQSSGFFWLLGIGGYATGTLAWLLGVPLPLLLILMLFRRTALTDPLARVVPRLEVALCFGLCISLCVVKVMGFLTMISKVLEPSTVGLAHVFALLGSLSVLLVAWFSVPPLSASLRPAALFGTSLVCTLIWLLVGALLGSLALLLIYVGVPSGAVLVVFGVLQLLVLGGLSHLCLRFIYRPQPA